MSAAAEQSVVLADLMHDFIALDTPAYERALVRFLDHDRRFGSDGPVRQHFLSTLGRVRERLDAVDPRDTGLPLDGGRRAALLAGLGELRRAQPRDEDAFRRLNVLPEMITWLAQRLGVFGEDYRAYVDTLPRRGSYRPRYLNFGPTGLCNLRCADCILWGALFRNGAGRGVPLPQVLTHLDDAEQAGGVGLSFCIGEPTTDMATLEAVLARVARSEVLSARSFVTNARFGRTRERAVAVWQRILASLGAERAAGCVFAVSVNPELTRQGVDPAHAVRVIDTFLEVMPNDLVIVQLIRDEGYLEQQRELLELLGEAGLLAGDAPVTEAGAGSLVRSTPLRGGRQLVFSVMAKMPPINQPGAEQRPDPYVFYLDPEAVLCGDVRGLFMRRGGSGASEEAAQGNQRLALGPDGAFYLDYHFMVRAVRPLGRSFAEAMASFERDPILTRLVPEGGLGAVLQAYQEMPESERPILDLGPLVGRYSTVSMAAANVLFGDEDIALRLARWLAERPAPVDAPSEPAI